MTAIKRKFLTLNAEESSETLRGIASPARIRILKHLREKGPLNVNEISEGLDLPQSTIATHIQVLERSGLIETETLKASKGQQKVCSIRFDEIIICFDDQNALRSRDHVEVCMPIGLYTSCDVSAPCGLCSTDNVLGVLDVPDFFLDPRRMNASLIWFRRGFVEYKFPNNGKVLGATIDRLEFIMELSSEVPGTNLDWPSEISLWVNNVKVGSWMSPSDFGDKRGLYTPHWWKLEGSQYGKLVTWQISRSGTSVNDVQISDVALDKLELDKHHGIRLRIGIDDTARHPGGINIFGRGFGNYDQDIVMRMHLKEQPSD